MTYSTAERASFLVDYAAQVGAEGNHTYICIPEEASLDREYPYQVVAPNDEEAALFASRIAYGEDSGMLACIDIPAIILDPISMYTGHGVHGEVMLINEVDISKG